jgi:hypothetical protein
VVQPFWAALQAGEFIADAAMAAGTYRKQGTRWVAACGGVRPRRGRDLNGRCLSFAEREEIALARARGDLSAASLAARAGRRRRSRASCVATPTGASVATGRPVLVVVGQMSLRAISRSDAVDSPPHSQLDARHRRSAKRRDVRPRSSRSRGVLWLRRGVFDRRSRIRKT